MAITPLNQVAELVAPATEPAAASEVDTTTARPEPSAKRPKVKKVAHPPRRRPFSVDTSTPLGTLRVTRS
jgi:hypothetical protein